MKGSKIILQGAVLVAIVAFAFYLAGVASDNALIQEIVSGYGYVGIFIIALISGFNLLVPIPAVAFLPLFLESGLLFWPAIMFITLGVTCADVLSYTLARAGKKIVSQSFGEKIFNKFHELGSRYPRSPLALLLLYACVVPLPNELILVPLVLFGYSLKRIIPIILFGNLIHQLLYAKGVLGIFNILW